MSFVMKMFITLNFLSSGDNEKLKTSSHLWRQDTSKYVSDDLESVFENLTPVQIFLPWPWSNFQIDFMSQQMHFSTRLNATNTMVFFSFSLSLMDKILSAINIFLKKVIFYLKPTWSWLDIRFTSNISTPFLDIFTGILVPFSDLF